MTSNNERESLVRLVNSNINSESSQDYRLSQDYTSGLYFRSNRPSFQVLPGVMILVLVLIERIAYYSLTSNLYLFLTERRFYWLYYNALSILLLFTGVSYIASLLGGWLSDAFFGRFKTIGFAFIIFSTSFWFIFKLADTSVFPHFLCSNEPWMDLTNSTHTVVPLFSEICVGPVISILIFAAIGTGVIKANITPFGAEQVRYTGSDGLKIYLNWLYWCVNIGALIAILGITYVQQEQGFYHGYLIPACLLTSATLLFWVSYPLYAHQKPSGSSISRIYYVIKEAWKSRKKVISEEPGSVNQPDWLDMAKVRYGGMFHEAVVEDVKSLSAILKVFVMLIPYWILYFQMQSTFLAQGLSLRLSFDSTNSSAYYVKEQKFMIPAAWLMLFNVVFLIIFIPVLNHLIYPCLTRHGIQISMLIRMGIGMGCAAVSMIIAGFLEWYRLDFIQEDKVVYQIIENTTFKAADLSILWQIPQYSLIGISEVFASVSGMEFACSQAPTRMQGAVMGLYYFCTGIGSFLGIAVLKIFEQVFNVLLTNPSVDINKGKMHCYFFLLAAIQLIAIIIFSFVSKNLKIRKLPNGNRSESNMSSNNIRS